MRKTMTDRAWESLVERTRERDALLAERDELRSCVVVLLDAIDSADPMLLKSASDIARALLAKAGR